jgi:acyl carrier protein
MNSIENELKELLISSLNLEDVTPNDIETEAPLFGDGLGLDSIDALELGVAIQKKYGISIKAQTEEVKAHFYSIKTLSQFIKNSQESAQ